MLGEELPVDNSCSTQALNDPVLHTQKCLNKLLNTAVVHVIDAPSLALIMPIVQVGVGRCLLARRSDDMPVPAAGAEGP